MLSTLTIRSDYGEQEQSDVRMQEGFDNRWRCAVNGACSIGAERKSHMTAQMREPVISVMLAVDDTPKAVEWYKRALGATELWNLTYAQVLS